MALNTQLSDLAVNTQAASLSTLLNGGTVELYDGAQPANADTAVTTQVLGVTLTFGTPAFGTPVSGVITSNAVTAGVAVAGITPTWGRFKKSDGSVVMDGSAGASGANITVGAFTAGTTVSVALGGISHDVRNATTGF